LEHAEVYRGHGKHCNGRSGSTDFSTCAKQIDFPEQITAASAFAQKSIAVLPLLNESGKPEDEYFSDGLSEELIAALAQIKELKVIGRSSSFRLRIRKKKAKSSVRN